MKHAALAVATTVLMTSAIGTGVANAAPVTKTPVKSYANVTMLTKPVSRPLPKPKPKPAAAVVTAPAAKLMTTSRSATRPPIATPSVPPGSAQQVAAKMLSTFGWGSDQMGCLSNLWTKESGWNVSASNPSSGAYGIPQALPGSKMASAGADWATNPATQIKWGLGYIKDRYSSPCGAWGHSQSVGWY